MSACAGKGEGRSRRMLAALKWRARHLLPPARAPPPGQSPDGRCHPAPQPTPAPPHQAEASCPCPCRHPGGHECGSAPRGQPAARGAARRCCGGQELRDGPGWPGRLCHSATVPRYFSVCSVRAARRCRSAILLIPASCS